MNHSEEIDQLATALALAQGEFGAAGKDGTNPHYNNKFASLKSVVQTAAPVLAKHGLSVASFVGYDEAGDTLTILLMHKSGQHVSETMRLHPVKVDPQGQGSATTYARRYSFQAALNLVSEEDDDGNAASAPQRSTPPAAQKTTTRRPPLRPQPEAVPKGQAKNELLAALGGDMGQFRTMWEQAGGEFNGDTVSRAALDRLLAKAKAATELDGAT